VGKGKVFRLQAPGDLDVKAPDFLDFRHYEGRKIVRQRWVVSSNIVKTAVLSVYIMYQTLFILSILTQLYHTSYTYILKTNAGIKV
jgi:hypothetical protein